MTCWTTNESINYHPIHETKTR